MATPRQFAINLTTRAAAYRKSITRIKQRASIQVLRTVVAATPVDTGLARGGWSVGIGASRDSGIRLDPTGSAAIGNGTGVISRAVGLQDIYVSNNIEYIGPLEHGSSMQAPSGMVQQALQAGAALVRASKITDKS
jgi:hypothetical protein